MRFLNQKSLNSLLFMEGDESETFLVEQFFKAKKCIYFHVTGVQDGLLKEQLAEFSKSIGKTFYNGATIETANTWMQAFDELNNALNNLSNSKKIIIFIDELPWMATKRSRILQALDYYWNHYWSKCKNIKLIICGSSASWIMKNIIYNKELLLKNTVSYQKKAER